MTPAAEDWTRAWRDPEGTGWVVAHAIPVGAGDQFVGVVGASTLLLDFLSGFLRAFDYPAGQLWLVDDRQPGAGGVGRPDPRRAALAGLDAGPAGGPARARAGELLRPIARLPRDRRRTCAGAAVGATPWTLLFVVVAGRAQRGHPAAPRALRHHPARADPDPAAGASLRQRLIVRPALALWRLHQGREPDQHPAQPPAAGALAAAGRARSRTRFARQREPLAQIQDSEAMKSAIIASALDGVIAIDEAGRSSSSTRAPSDVRHRARGGLGQPMAELIMPAHLRELHHQGMQRYLADRPARWSSAAGSRWRRCGPTASRSRSSSRSPRSVRPAGACSRPICATSASGARMQRALRESEQHFRTHRRGPPGAGRDRAPRGRPDPARQPGLRRSVRRAARRARRPGRRRFYRRPPRARIGWSARCARTARSTASSSTHAARRRQRVPDRADLAADRVPGRAGVRHRGGRPDRAASGRGRDRAPARGAAPEREADGARLAARRRRARAQQPAVGGGRLRHACCASWRRTPATRAARGRGPRRGRALRPDRRAPSSPWRARSRRSAGRCALDEVVEARSSSPATACGPPTSRSCSTSRRTCRRSGATATSCTRC